MPPVFEPLQSNHDRQSFDCGREELNRFLQRQARQNAERDIGVTHVAVRNAGDARILAYYTLVTRTVDAANIPNKKLPTGEIGVVLLRRLAVDGRAQGQKLARLCLLRAMSQVERASREIGIHALVLDAIDERARDYYLSLKFGFQTLNDDPNHLYLPVATIRGLTD